MPVMPIVTNIANIFPGRREKKYLSRMPVYVKVPLPVLHFRKLIGRSRKKIVLEKMSFAAFCVPYYGSVYGKKKKK